MTRSYTPRGLSLQQRVLSCIEIVPSGCWIWERTKTNEGYGHIGIGARMVLAHRAAYEAFKGPIRAGLTIDHLCKNPSCVNPQHLEAVPLRENLMRGTSFSAVNAAKTHCIKGHPLSGDNLYIAKNRRQCRRCNADAVARYAARKVTA